MNSLLFSSENVTTFYKDGTRKYIDAGNQLEIAAAESGDGHSAAVRSRAALVFAIQRAIERQVRYAKKHKPKKLALVVVAANSATNLKKPTEQATFGYHQNHLVARQFDFDYWVSMLLPFFFSSQLFAGTGMVLPADGFEGEDKSGYRMAMSQRAFFMDFAYSNGALSHHGMFSTRDEPHANPDLYRRMHIKVNEANILFGAEERKLTITSLLFLMAEHGAITPPKFTDEHAVKILKRVAGGLSPSFDQPFDNFPNEISWALETQWTYYHQAVAFVKKHGLLQFLPVMAQWKQILEALESENLAALIGVVDWVTKWRLIKEYEDRRDKPLTYPQARYLDVQYHTVHGGDLNWPQKLWKIYDPPGLDKEVAFALENPPHDRRSKLRGDFVATVLREKIPAAKANWDIIGIGGTEVELDDPFVTEDARVKTLIAGFFEQAQSA